jgi:shikimate kinase/3-dehydroquinate synthase
VPLARHQALSQLPRLVGARRVALIADREVLRVLGAPIEPFVTVRLPAGEPAKTIAVARQAWRRLADLGFERGDVVVGLGGGAATDVAGFVAATYQRGVPWIAVPTSLVGMVDAAIGGKTGVDLGASKNYVGAFHLPEWTVADPAVLDTLPVREWACGFAEIIKAALLAGGALWDQVRAWRPGRGTADERLELIRRSGAYKAHVVAQDPREAGVRAVLNLGHTIGHAVESATGYRAYAHGEAVAIGLPPALWLSTQVCGLDPGVELEVRDLLRRHGLPVRAAGVDAQAVLAAMRRDKKVRAGRFRFVLLSAVGAPLLHTFETGEDLVEQAVARALTR